MTEFWKIFKKKCFLHPFHKRNTGKDLQKVKDTVLSKHVIDSKEGEEIKRGKKDGEEKKAGERRDPFKWKIDGYSTIANLGADIYYSRSFAACGFNWKLRLESVLEESDHQYVGLYISNDEDSKCLKIKARYKLFIYDQIHAEHIQMEGEDYFNSTSRHGFCCKVSLNKFNNVKYGLLVDDSCVFGVELLEASEIEREGISESLSLKKDITPIIYTWVIKDVSNSKEELLSEVFTAGIYNWRIWLYPNSAKYINSLAVFLSMDNAASLSSKTSVYVKFSICLLDLHNAKHYKFTGKQLFMSNITNWGWSKFLSWKDVQDPSRGFLRNDTCIIEASVVILGVDTIA